MCGLYLNGKTYNFPFRRIPMKDKRLTKIRNKIILAAFKNEISLQTQVVKDRKKYSRKQKHKNTEDG